MISSRFDQLPTIGVLSRRREQVWQGSSVGPTTPKRKHFGLGSSPVARRYWGNHICFLFLRVLRCFSSPRAPLVRDDGSLHPPGCPIRRPIDHSLLAAPYGISSLCTSFVGTSPQGIHQRPCVALKLCCYPNGERERSARWPSTPLPQISGHKAIGSRKERERRHT